VRLWLLKNASINAIFALPAGAFAPTTGIRLNVVLLTKDQGESGDRVFMASLKNVGYDRRGRPSKANDLPVLAEDFRRFRETGAEPSSDKCWVVSQTEEFVNRLDVEFYQPRYRDVVRKIREMGVPLLRLEEVADAVFQGASLPRSELSESGIPIVGRLQLVTGRLDHAGARHVPKEYADTKLQNMVLKEGDLLVTTIGTPGDCALVTAKDVPAIAGQSVAVIRLTTELAEPLFLRLLFGTNWIMSQISMVVQGKTILRLNLTELGDILIPLPPLGVQTSIADLLRRASAARDEAQELEREALTALQNCLEVAYDDAD